MDFVREAPRQASEEADLVARCLRGDDGAFHALAVRYYRPVAAFLLKRAQRPDLAEDLAQDTFLEAFRSLKAGRRPDHFASWLFGIAHNCHGKWARRKKPVLFDPEAAPHPPTVPPEIDGRAELEEQAKLLAALDAGLASLPEDVRRLLDLKHREGKTCEQIAGELNRPVGTIKSLLSRTYKTLRDRLRPALGDDR
jgi:RNA polymerase sigma-70 factor (ECF subfamily)